MLFLLLSGFSHVRLYSTLGTAPTRLLWPQDSPGKNTGWTEQWPLTKEKLHAAKELIDAQLELKHIEESCSP